MFIFGHRGAAGHYPENTLGGFARAIDYGVDGIELDIRLIDHELIVFHDDTLDRCTDGSGNIYTKRLDELRNLDAGNGERIPTLEEVMRLIDARCVLNIEIKQDGLIAELTALLARTMSMQSAWHNRLMLSSFLPGPLRELAALKMPGWRLAALSDQRFAQTLQFAQEIAAHSINVSRAELSREIVSSAHAAGLQVFVYTVNDTQEFRRCADCNADGLFTDFPDRAIAFFGESVENDLP